MRFRFAAVVTSAASLIALVLIYLAQSDRSGPGDVNDTSMTSEFVDEAGQSSFESPAFDADNASAENLGLIEAAPTPDDLNSENLYRAARRYFDIFRYDQKTVADFYDDQELFAAWSDLWWRVIYAVDFGNKLYSLAEYGVTYDAEGGFDFDLDRFPGWRPLHKRLRGFATNDASRIDDLKAIAGMGMNEISLAALEDYMTQHPYPGNDAVIAANQKLAREFAEQYHSGSMSGAGSPRLLDLMWQWRANREEAERVWTDGLLDSLEPSQRDLLVSIYMGQGGGMGIGGGDDLDAVLKRFEQNLIAIAQDQEGLED